jgi:hypothetical protein
MIVNIQKVVFFDSIVVNLEKSNVRRYSAVQNANFKLNMYIVYGEYSKG